MAIDLTSYTEILANQENSNVRSSLFAIHGIGYSGAIVPQYNAKSTLTSGCTSSDTILNVAGFSEITSGYIVVESEIMAVLSSTSSTITVNRGQLGTVALAHSTGKWMYTIQVMTTVENYGYNQKTDISSSDPFGVSVDGGNVTLIDLPSNWNNISPTRQYIWKPNQECFIFEGVNGQFIKTYEGITYSKAPTSKENRIKIEFKNPIQRWFTQKIDFHKIYDEKTIEEVLEGLFTGYTVVYPTIGITSANFIKVRNLYTKEFATYGDLLKYICKEAMCRIRFRQDKTILLFSDAYINTSGNIDSSLVIPTGTTIQANLLDINDDTTNQLIINTVKGTYLERSDLYNQDDLTGSGLGKFNNKCFAWAKSKDFTGTTYNFIVAWKWKSVTLANVDADVLKVVTVNDNVLITSTVDGEYKEYWCKVSAINSPLDGDLELITGIDKPAGFNELGRLEPIRTGTQLNLETDVTGLLALSTFTLYAGITALPIATKYARSVGGEDRDSMLRFPIVRGFPQQIELNFNYPNNNVSKFSGVYKGFDALIAAGWIENTDGMYYNKEYIQTLPMYVYANHIDGQGNITDIDNNGFRVKVERSKPAPFVKGITSMTNTVVESDITVTIENTKAVGETTYSITPTSVGIGGSWLTIAKPATVGWELNYGDVLLLNAVLPSSPNKYARYLAFKEQKFTVDFYEGEELLVTTGLTVGHSYVIKSEGTTNFELIGATAGYIVGDTFAWNGVAGLGTGTVVDLVPDNYNIYFANEVYPQPTTDLIGLEQLSFTQHSYKDVVLLNELYFRGNPVMQTERNIYEYDVEEIDGQTSVDLYGEKPYELSGKFMRIDELQKAISYLIQTYKGTSASSTRMIIDFELQKRLDLEVGDTVYVTDTVYTGIDTVKCMITEKVVNEGGASGTRTEKYSSITVGNYNIIPSAITLKSTLNYLPVVATTYSHRGAETKTKDTNPDGSDGKENKALENKRMMLQDDYNGFMQVEVVELDSFTADVDIPASFPLSNVDQEIVIPLKGVTVSQPYRDTFLTSGREGLVRIHGEYMTYVSTMTVSANKSSIKTLRRGIGKTEQQRILNNDTVQFFKIISKIGVDGLITNSVDIGDGSKNYIKMKALADDNMIYLNDGSQQMGGSVTDTSGTYTGLFIGDTTLANNKYLKYNTAGAGTLDIKTANGYIGNANNHFDITTGLIYLNSGAQQLGVGIVDSSVTPYNGLFVGDTVLSNNNYLKCDGTTITLKSTNDIYFSNGTGVTRNEFYFTPTVGESYVSLNGGNQQIGYCWDSVDTYFKGMFMGDLTLTNENYIKYNQDTSRFTFGDAVQISGVMKAGDAIKIEKVDSSSLFRAGQLISGAYGMEVYPDITTINAGSFSIGVSYTISFVGTTVWGDIGGAPGTLGTVFTATGVGSGTGKANPTSTLIANYFKIDDTNGIQLKTTKLVDISNTNNALKFDNTGNSYLKMNASANYHKQQLGYYSQNVLGAGEVNAYGLFCGNPESGSTSYFYYDGTADVMEIYTKKIKIVGTDDTTGIAIGYNAGLTNLDNNIAIGHLAMSAITGGASDNIGIGNNVLKNLSVGSFNIGVGEACLSSNLSGNYNLAMGRDSMLANTIGSFNVALGYRTLYSNTQGEYNVAIGFNALKYTTWATGTEGSNNTAIGYEALVNNTSGQNNIAIGSNALHTSTNASHNIAIGTNALFTNDPTGANGYQNLAIGYKGLYSNTIGFKNLAIGYEALLSNTDGKSNTAIASQAMYSNQTGDYNVALGQAALYTSTGNENTGIGFNALYTTTGNSNTAIGAYAGNSITTGSNNTCIGFDSDVSSASVSNEVTIGNSSVTSVRTYGALSVINTTDASDVDTGAIITDGGLAIAKSAYVGGKINVAQGVQFPSGFSNSSDPNTLDDYEEGTWTMGFAFGGGTTGITYADATHLGRYTKIGKLCTVTGYCSLTSKGSSTGDLTLTGLPFVSENSLGGWSTALIGFFNVARTGAINAYLSSNNQTIVVAQSSDAGVYSAITSSDCANDSAFIINLTYHTT